MGLICGLILGFLGVFWWDILWLFWDCFGFALAIVLGLFFSRFGVTFLYLFNLLLFFGTFWG